MVAAEAFDPAANRPRAVDGQAAEPSAGGRLVAEGVVPGAVAGVAGGLLFAAATTSFGMLQTVASLVRAESLILGFAVHLVIAAIIGTGFGAAVQRQRGAPGDTLLWGLAYGALWWVLGPLTLLPLLLGDAVTWDIAAAREQFPSLLGHLVYGAGAAGALPVVRLLVVRGRRQGLRLALRVVPAALLRGTLAGAVAGGVCAAVTAGQAPPALLPGFAAASPWLVWTGTGVLLGLGYALLYPQPTDSAGAAACRGTAYGFVWWVAGALTLRGLLDGDGLAWSLQAARERVGDLIGALLLGAAVALAAQAIGRLVHLLVSDGAQDQARELTGRSGVRALAWGSLGGLVGGLVFTVVMVQIGFLPTVARLVGSASPVTGFVVHLLIADVIGASYGLLFRRQSYDLGSALGWGVAYGLFWWVIGPLTLLPVLLGGAPQWTQAAVAATFASLVGHLAYGAALGVTFQQLEARHNPWWLTRTQAEAARAEGRRREVLSSGPALWVLTALIVLTVPLLLAP